MTTIDHDDDDPRFHMTQPNDKCILTYSAPSTTRCEHEGTSLLWLNSKGASQISTARQRNETFTAGSVLLPCLYKMVCDSFFKILKTHFYPNEEKAGVS